MIANKTFTVAPLGISEEEQRVLKNIFKLSMYRNYSYRLWDKPFDAQYVDLLIVDHHDPGAMSLWRTSVNHRLGHHEKIPAVLVMRLDDTSSDYTYLVRRPFVATRVLSMLDKLVQKELGVGSQPPTVQPRSTISRDGGKKAPSPAATSTKEFRHRALVVDDSLPIRKQLELELRLYGVQADFASTGEEAMMQVENGQYDLIFLDVILPGLDGYQVCRNIKRSRATKKTPVIMLTSKSSPFDRIRGTFAGCDTYLTKPLSQDAFRRVVDKYLSS